LLNPKVLIRPDQADKAKGKNIIIREKRRNEKLSLEETPKIAAKASTLGRQDTAEKADSASTNLATAQGGLTGSRGGLTASQCGLTATSRKNEDAPEKKVKPSFEELLDKYKSKGAARKRRNQPISAKGEKASPRHEKQESAHHQQGNFAYPFVGSVTPCSWYYPCYYSPTDYSSMYMKSYMIQYLIAYPNHDKLQRPIAYSNNLVKKMYVLLSSKVGVAMSKILRVCNRGGVPQACRTLKKGDYSGCESKDQWSNLQQPHQHGQQLSMETKTSCSMSS
jgi:hypothetical protein